MVNCFGAMIQSYHMNTTNEPSEYDKYLASLHSARQTDEKVIMDVVKEATGSDINSKRRIVAGEVNEVYEVVLSNGNAVIVRISNEEDKDFKGEKWALQQVAAINVPIAKILLVKTIGENSFCIQNKLSGEPLERGNLDFWQMDATTLKPLIVEAGTMLARIHSIPTVGYGPIDEKGKGEHNSWTRFLSENNRNRSAYPNTPLMRSVFQYLDAEIPRVRAPNPVLNHNDFGPKHFMIQANHITGILDFGDAESHSYVNDLAKWDYWYGHKAPLSWLLEGYTKTHPLDADFEHTKKVITLVNGLSVWWWYNEVGYKERVKETEEKLERFL